ncbi:histidinol-phosphatase (PHP family) [Amphibacillus marinus]|uniref:Histidinol-phosphatase n=1 Tax=Amphibacillus marinus TaxID=872970 RepID=A0A1H8GW06_9BACI|nr:histidinol-phosphatase HisJ [Amphibacillus marinus]SEN48045.1 histidinol-phosphatase (PHP family) [Amphibacillus marinus]
MILGDYHVHTPYCPHGSTDRWEQYIIKAIELGLEEISFTEHAPLPESFEDPVPEKDSAMNRHALESYLAEGLTLKQQFASDIKINLGFELDYLEGYEFETSQFLNTYGEVIDDAILSVHMLRLATNHYACLDYSADHFGEIANQLGSTEQVYDLYYRTIEKAVCADLGKYKPTRIGHLTLIEKFKQKYPLTKDNSDQIEQILRLIKDKQYCLDINTAGLYKPDCLSIYPNKKVIQRAKELFIPLVPGSDSHEAATLTRGFQLISPYLD